MEEEAAIIRRIYREFLQGKSPYMIANGLKADGIPTPSKKNTNWQQSVVRSILSNEKYKGDALLQKSFTVDFLTKKMKKNEGEVPQYYVEGSHPAIIDPEVFEQVQVEIERSVKSSYRVAASIFSSKLYCAACGSAYGSKVWHSTDQYRRVIWQCNAKFKNTTKCGTPHLTENEIQAAFVDAFNISFTHRNEALADYKRILDEVTDVSELQAQGDAAKEAHEGILQEMASAIHRNATMTLNQQEYATQYDRLLERAAVAKAKADEAENLIAAKAKQKCKLLGFIHELESHTELLSEFDERLWTATVDKVIVGGAELVFCFKDGSKQVVKRKTA